MIVVVDTLRRDHVGSYGYERSTTPFLDRLSGEGVLFENAASTSPWTVPAVASLVTGLLPDRHGAGRSPDSLTVGDGSPPTQFPGDLPSLSERLKGRGFSTFHFSANPFLYGRFEDGYDASEVRWTSAPELTDAALAWWSGHEGKPRFLYLQYMDAHQPNRPPKEYLRLFGLDPGEERPEEASDWEFKRLTNPEDPAFLKFRRHRIGAYDGSIRLVDDQIARLVEGLRSSSDPESTLVVVTSDHGEEFWDHAMEGAALADDARGIWGVGHGHTVYRELMEIPLIVAGSGFTPGLRADCAVSIADIFPTVLRATGSEVPSDIDGFDLAEQLETSRRCVARPILFGSVAYGPATQGIRSGDLKLVVRGGVRALFDLARDPEERSPSSADLPAGRALADALEARTASAPRPGRKAAEYDEALREQLRALGYL